MRKSRLKAPPHHRLASCLCISRVVNRELVLGPEEKEEFVRLMRLDEGLCKLRVITCCVMGNYFHGLAEVPLRPATMTDDAQLLAMLTHI